MAKLTLNLPPHCQIKDRGKYADVYFMVHPKDRPQGWRASIHLGRTDRKSSQEIETAAQDTYADFIKFIDRVITGEDISKRPGTLPDVISKYKASGFWSDLALNTRKDYELYLKEIEDWSKKANHPHISNMTIKSVVKWLNQYEDRPVRQKRARTVLSILFEVAKQEGFVERNLAKGLKLRIRKTEKRKLVIWEDEHLVAFVAKANEMGFSSVGRAVVMGIETGQRRGDVLKMQKPRDYDNGRLKFKQSKTGKLVDIKATKVLTECLKGIPETQLVLFLNERTGRPWNESVFAHTVREIADQAGLKNHIFAHLRHSAILYLHRAGVDARGIAAITGHSLKTINQMLENHYLETRDQEVADKAIDMLEKHREMKSQTNQDRRESDNN